MGSCLQEGEEERIMEGWLYLIHHNHFGQRHLRRRYFVLDDNVLNCFPSAQESTNRQVPQKRVFIESCIRVKDDGRENIQDNVYFTFTLCNFSDRARKIKLGARSSEEAAKWIRSLLEVAANLKDCQSHKQGSVGPSKSICLPFRLSQRRTRSHTNTMDWTASLSMNMDPMACDVAAPPHWTIFGCINGLRIFKETKDGYSHGKHWDEHPAIMAVGMVDASTEAVFQTIMSLGHSRSDPQFTIQSTEVVFQTIMSLGHSISEWDFCFGHGSVVECVDGHTDIIHKQLKSDWLPWDTLRRDLLLKRFWRREDDGTYVILYQSVYQKGYQPERGCIRACLKSGGYVISPVHHGGQSVVRHMLSIDWKFWRSYLFSSSAKYITIKMLGRIAALREYFKTTIENYQISNTLDGKLSRESRNHSCQQRELAEAHFTGEITVSVESTTDELQNIARKEAVVSRSFTDPSDTCDEFFDVPEESEHDSLEAKWSSDAYFCSQDQCQNKLTRASSFVKRFHDRQAQKKMYNEVQVTTTGESLPWTYGSTLPRDPTCNLLSTWAMTDPSTFLIRGPTYLWDRHKIKACGTLMQMVAADWLKSDKREDDLAGRPHSIVQKYASQGGKEFFFIINIQVPGSTTYSLAFYYMMDTPLEDIPLLERFVKGDDAFRNSRFKLIPYISKGPWIVKRSVGRKACLVGQALEMNYFHGKNYIELGVDIGSSAIARGVVSIVLGYLSNLVIEMAFLVQGNKEEELPEFLLGTCRLNHLDPDKAIALRPW